LELTVRSILGAGRWRLLRQLLVESMVLSDCGGLLGVFLGWSLVRILPSLLPRDFPRLADIRLDWRVLGFAPAVSLVSGLLSGLAPVVRGSRQSDGEDLQIGARLSREGCPGRSCSWRRLSP